MNPTKAESMASTQPLGYLGAISGQLMICYTPVTLTWESP